MEKSNKRAIRRHHIARLKKSRAHYFVVNWWSEEYKQKRLGLVVSYPKMCSCPMCGNPRKWLNERTIQEMRDLERMEYDLEELSDHTQEDAMTQLNAETKDS
jgi:hypothetical protein